MRSDILLAAVLLAGCNTAVGADLSRAAARPVVDRIVADRFPGLPLKPATDCIIDNASGDEIVTLATAAATRDDATAIGAVSDVARRPETLRCLGADALPVILNSL